MIMSGHMLILLNPCLNSPGVHETYAQVYHLLDHSKVKYLNFISYLQVSKSCRSLVYVSVDPYLWSDTKHGNYMPVTLAMYRHLTG